MGDNNNKVAVMSDGVKTLDGMTGNTRYVIYDGKGKKMSAPKDKVDSKGFAAYAAKLPGGTVELVKGNDVFNVPLDEAEAAIADGMRPFTFFKAGKNQPKKRTGTPIRQEQWMPVSVRSRKRGSLRATILTISGLFQTGTNHKT